MKIKDMIWDKFCTYCFTLDFILHILVYFILCVIIFLCLCVHFICMCRIWCLVGVINDEYRWKWFWPNLEVIRF